MWYVLYCNCIIILSWAKGCRRLIPSQSGRIQAETEHERTTSKLKEMVHNLERKAEDRGQLCNAKLSSLILYWDPCWVWNPARSLQCILKHANVIPTKGRINAYNGQACISEIKNQHIQGKTSTDVNDMDQIRMGCGGCISCRISSICRRSLS